MHSLMHSRAAGLQSRQLHAPLRAPERGLTLIAIQHPVEAPEDWSQDYQSLQDGNLPDGGGCGTREAVPVDAIENPSSGEGMRESACLAPVKDGNGKQGGFKRGTSVSRQREITRPGGDVERSVGGHAMECGQPCRKDRILHRMSALEASYGQFRFLRVLFDSI